MFSNDVFSNIFSVKTTHKRIKQKRRGNEEYWENEIKVNGKKILSTENCIETLVTDRNSLLIVKH